MPALFALPPPDPAFELLVTSQGMSQGVLQTDGIQIMPRFYVRSGDLQLGGQWRNVDSPTFKGVAAIFLKFSRKLPKGQLDAGLFYRIRTSVKGKTDSQAWEFSAAGRRDFGRLRLRASADFSPKDFARGRSLFVEIGPAFDLDRLTRLSANIGRRERRGAPDYTAFNAGVSRMVGKQLTLDARYYDTNRAGLGEPFQGRIVLSARLAL